jgi:2-polyprenyl-6-methoxyphenol hydroxylase-like FAD-dependent oxidoreductase
VDTQVIVVGAGPVGLLLAGELRLGGAHVVVVERLTEPTGESRASQLNARTMEVFDQRGLLDRLGPLESVGAGHFGGIPLDVSEVPSHHPGFWKVPQFRTEAMLQDWAVELGADLRRGHELRGLAEETDHVRAEVTGPHGTVELRASFVVGCDGEQSTVRQLAGFDFPGSDATKELLRADVSGIDVPNRRFERRENGLAIAARRPDGVTRVMVHEFGRPAVRRDRPPTFDEVVTAWARVTGENIAGGTPEWVDAFGDASRHVTTYRRGPVLLAGDAAHLQMPAGGQALNLGVQDAANLGWKLAAQVRGWAPEGLLASYHDERHPVGARVLTNVRAQALLLLGGPEVNAARAILAEVISLDVAGTHLAVTVSGLDIRYDHELGDHPLVGARMPHTGLVLPRGDATDTTALLHRARGVLLDLSGDGLRPAAAGWADRVDHVPAKAQPDGALDGLDAVLVRPDGHVAWAGVPGDQAGPGAALRRWFGAPVPFAAVDADHAWPKSASHQVADDRAGAVP